MMPSHVSLRSTPVQISPPSMDSPFIPFSAEFIVVATTQVRVLQDWEVTLQ